MNNETKCSVNPGAEIWFDNPIHCLDHGFIRLEDYMGDDNAIARAVRVSYGKGTRQVSEDKGLIRYLFRHRHTTPFEMVEFKFHCKLPISVAANYLTIGAAVAELPKKDAPMGGGMPGGMQGMGDY